MSKKKNKTNFEFDESSEPNQDQESDQAGTEVQKKGKKGKQKKVDLGNSPRKYDKFQ